MKEKQFQSLWGKYLVSHPLDSAEAHELKVTNTHSIHIDAVKPHQILGLQQAYSGLYYKIRDMAATNGFADPKPFDCFWLKNALGFVVILFYKPRKPKIVYKIPVDVWVTQTKNYPKKSLREVEIASWQGIEIIDLTYKTKELIFV